MISSKTYWLWLTLAFGPSNSHKWDIYDRFKNIEAVYEALNNENDFYLLSEEKRLIKSATMHMVDNIFNQCEKLGINVISYDEKEYPQRLKNIYNPPSVLFTYGDESLLNYDRSIAVIGSRSAEDYSIKCTDILSYQLAQYGAVIVSGFAKGIDTAAHFGAINAGGKTIAVLGCGINYDYPKGSNSLKKKIAENGVVVSEYYPGTMPSAVNFPLRNRILAGLSDGIVVTQAAKKSGALNTVSHALDMGRSIFCIPPHDIFHENYDGQIGILKDGALEIYSADDITRNLYGDNI